MIMKNNKQDNNQIIIYEGDEGQPKLEVQIENETVWLTQKLMAELFEVDVRTVNEHLQNIFKTEELEPNSVIRNFRITATDGKKYDTKHYNLDVITALGYRVNSKRATRR